MRDWNELHRDEQIKLLIEYGYYLDELPSTCSMQSKEERLRDWLAQRKVAYSAGQLRNA